MTWRKRGLIARRVAAYQPGGTGRHPPEACAKLELSSPVSRSSRSGGRSKHLANFWWAAEPVGPNSKPPPVRVRAACSRQRLVLDHPRLRRRLERPERWKACQRQVRAAQSVEVPDTFRDNRSARNSCHGTSLSGFQDSWSSSPVLLDLPRQATNSPSRFQTHSVTTVPRGTVVTERLCLDSRTPGRHLWC